jgi:hypothetical protein
MPYLAGWVAGTALGTWLLVTVHCKTTSYSVSLFGHHEFISIGILAVLVNLAVALAVSGAVRVAGCWDGNRQPPPRRPWRRPSPRPTYGGHPNAT